MLDHGLRAAIVVISDRVERSALPPGLSSHLTAVGHAPRGAAGPAVIGGYLERLPLAAIRAGLVGDAEIWHHCTGSIGSYERDNSHLARRVFPLGDDRAPFHSEAMLDFIRRHGAPRILCIWGLGVSEEILDACRDSIIVYNSIDAPALRVPVEISCHFDLVLTGAQWQSDAVRDRHPGMATAIMPIGPEFASPETFFPTGAVKTHDVIYVAAAQPYKRHDILFSAMTRSPRPLNALCVIGYGEDGAALRERAAELNLAIDFVGPPGVSHAEVNRLMSQARVGVVCGVDDGAPAILTEYMLAGLPVVANSRLACGLQYILPQTGIIAAEDAFEHAILSALDEADRFAPRQTVLENWAWPHSIRRLEHLLDGLSTPSNSFQQQGGSLEPAASN